MTKDVLIGQQEVAMSELALISRNRFHQFRQNRDQIKVLLFAVGMIFAYALLVVAVVAPLHHFNSNF